MMEEVMTQAADAPVVVWYVLGAFLAFVAYRVYKSNTKPRSSGPSRGGSRKEPPTDQL